MFLLVSLCVWNKMCVASDGGIESADAANEFYYEVLLVA
jgi:hypothetical protein